MNRLGKVEYCMSLDSLQENPEFLRAGGTVGAIVYIKKIIGSRMTLFGLRKSAPRKALFADTEV